MRFAAFCDLRVYTCNPSTTQSLGCRAQVPCVFALGENGTPTWTADVYISRDIIEQLRAHRHDQHPLLQSAQPGPPQHQHQCVRVSFDGTTFLTVANAVRRALEPDSASKRQSSYAALNRYVEYRDKLDSSGRKRALPDCKPLDQIGERQKQRRVTAVLQEHKATISKLAADEVDAAHLEAEVRRRTGAAQQQLRSKPQMRDASVQLCELLACL